MKNVLLVIADGRRREYVIHKPARKLETLYRNGCGANSQVSDPFVMDFVCPARFDETIYGRLNDDVPEMKRIENAGVEDSD